MVPLQKVGLEAALEVVAALVNRLENGASLFEMLFFKRQPVGYLALSEKLVVGQRWTGGGGCEIASST